MVAFSPLRPGAWLMRRLKLPGKLGWCAAQSLVAVVLAVMAAPWWLTAAACILMLYVQLVLWLTLSHDMALVARSMQQTTQGDLTVHASLQGHDEMAEMARSLDQMVYKLSAMVADIRSNAALVAHAGQSLAHGNRALADRTEQQAANLEETAASVEELSSTVQNNAHRLECRSESRTSAAGGGHRRAGHGPCGAVGGSHSARRAAHERNHWRD